MMKRNGASSVKVVGVVGVAVLVIGGAVWGLARVSAEVDKNPLELPENLLVDSLKQQAKESPDTMIETMRGLRRNEELTDEQRRAARRNMGVVWRERMDKSVEEYFAASDGEKDAVLDRHIDEMQALRKRMEAQREQWRREREAEGRQDGEDSKDREARRQEMIRRHVGATRADRKSRSESRSPDQSARRGAYFAAMRKRAQERGIDMGRRGGHGGGSRDRGSGR